MKKNASDVPALKPLRYTETKPGKLTKRFFCIQITDIALWGDIVCVQNRFVSFLVSGQAARLQAVYENTRDEAHIIGHRIKDLYPVGVE